MTRPTFLWQDIMPASFAAMPQDSCPLCCKEKSPLNVSYIGSRSDPGGAAIPKTPHSSRNFRPDISSYAMRIQLLIAVTGYQYYFITSAVKRSNKAERIFFAGQRAALPHSSAHCVRFTFLPASQRLGQKGNGFCQTQHDGKKTS
jgi:hypothetical protein